jgi:hypothetical protein
MDRDFHDHEEEEAETMRALKTCALYCALALLFLIMCVLPMIVGKIRG